MELVRLGGAKKSSAWGFFGGECEIGRKCGPPELLIGCGGGGGVSEENRIAYVDCWKLLSESEWIL